MTKNTIKGAGNVASNVARGDIRGAVREVGNTAGSNFKSVVGLT